ncbi:MAG: hypothetical protein ETSY1_01990 [Candidatus Entotheonella factor]|uniref:Uncharacterized protein n=1 Tax=Entotheonella factor TaxID=1429438 RepID=W4LY68_ENTF1|nr:MAG: hypothetical protein ETSY1_01990 [Candidatus Entotheonella factor]
MTEHVTREINTAEGIHVVTEAISNFRRLYNIDHIIALVGGSQETQDEDIISAIIRLHGYHVAILSGGTEWGVPHTAVVHAKQHNIKTIGVYPETGKKYAHGADLLDLRICVAPTLGESAWGDESEVFAKLLDGVIVFGGSTGTSVELSHLLKMNEAIMKKEGVLKYIVPVAGTGGAADELHNHCYNIGAKREALPIDDITTGDQAANFLINRLNLRHRHDEPDHIEHSRSREVKTSYAFDHSHHVYKSRSHHMTTSEKALVNT